ncbi:MAG: sodium-dependent transporter, partial [Gemmatimonadota bacterium]
TLLAIAALTSSMSLLEVASAWLIDEWDMSRKRAATTIGAIAFVVGIPSALANGAVGWLTELPGVGLDFLSLLFTIFGQYALVVGALLISIFIAWVWGVQEAGKEVRVNDGKFALARTWTVLIRYLAPIAILAILIQLVAGLGT